jgi:hypothetical protein
LHPLESAAFARRTPTSDIRTFANKQLEASPYQCTQLVWYHDPLGIYVHRREFLYVLGGEAVAWPHAKQAKEGLE